MELLQSTALLDQCVLHFVVECVSIVLNTLKFKLNKCKYYFPLLHTSLLLTIFVRIFIIIGNVQLNLQTK